MKTKSIIADLSQQTEVPDFAPTRAAGLARLALFADRSGELYDRCRNYDLGPDQRANVSVLSPWIRYRLISEIEVLDAALGAHGLKKAERFVHEVFWRTYFKGWLEQHPTVWPAYQAGLLRQLNSVEKDRRLAATYAQATAGETGIQCFDAWVQTLLAKGYLHNHARMWFASIWIFTLRLPWELGADFFLRHLLDGDPASNTLAWRWVAGIHTKGRPYIARASNISKFTNGQFCPTHQLTTDVRPVVENTEHLRRPLPPAKTAEEIEGEYLLLLTEDDMGIGDTLGHPPLATLGALATQGRSPLCVGALPQAFAADAMRNLCGAQCITDQEPWAPAIISACATHRIKQVVTGYAPVGPVAEALGAAQADVQAAGIQIHQVRRPYDTAAWPHATKGFFAMKKAIPSLLEQLVAQD